MSFFDDGLGLKSPNPRKGIETKMQGAWPQLRRKRLKSPNPRKGIETEAEVKYFGTTLYV